MAFDDLVNLLDASFDGWAKALSVTEKAALRHYQGQGYKSINEVLRFVVPGSLRTEQQLIAVDAFIEDLDRIVAKGSIPVQLLVYRGVHEIDWLGVDLTSLVGEMITDPGFMSTSLDPRSAFNKISLSKTGAILELSLKVGQPAAWLRPVGKVAYRDELEILLPRRTRFVIRGVSEYEGKPMIRVEVL